MLPSVDFETYSEAGFIIDPVTGHVRGSGARGKGGLPLVGTPVYAEHASAEVLCMAYDMHDGKGPQLWTPAAPYPVALLDHVRQGGAIAAWNVTFEFYIWNMVCVRRYGWPSLPLDQCHCDMAKSRRHSLPGALDKAAEVLGTARKDKEGKRLLQKLTRPHSTTKNRQAPRWTPATAWEDYLSLYSYCKQDVVAEDAAAARIPDLTESERAAWLVDQTINARGVQVDVAALDACLNILEQATTKYTAELHQITGGAVTTVSEVANFQAWLNSNGVNIPNMQKDTVDLFCTPATPEGPRRALQIRQLLGAANVKKLHTLKQQLSSDGRLRDQYKWCGADRTGRASAGGVQLQNITAKGPAVARCEACDGIYAQASVELDCPRCGAMMHLSHTLPEWCPEAVEAALADIMTRDLSLVEAVWINPVEVLCGCLRGLFVAPPERDLIVADFTAIEAVVLACLSRCMWRVEVFNSGRSIYLESISRITGVPYHEYEQYKQANGRHHPDRKRGKVAELASGYGGWVGAWVAFGADEFMNETEIKQAVLAWREASPEIVEFWGGQFRNRVPTLYGLEGAAISAIQRPGELFQVHDIGYWCADDILYCRLPSGRLLHYHRPRLVNDTDRFTKQPCWKITFEGYNSNPAKGPVGWHRMETYGGRLAENVTQAVAADLQFDSQQRLEAAQYPVVIHTHDENVAEMPAGLGTVEHMCAIMSERPEWASWWPIAADGWRGKRYGKD